MYTHTHTRCVLQYYTARTEGRAPERNSPRRDEGKEDRSLAHKYLCRVTR